MQMPFAKMTAENSRQSKTLDESRVTRMADNFRQNTRTDRLLTDEEFERLLLFAQRCQEALLLGRRRVHEEVDAQRMRGPRRLEHLPKVDQCLVII